MAGEWATLPLGDLTVNFDGRRVPVKEADRKPGPYPYYGASGIVDHVDGYLFDGDYLLIAEDGENLRTRQTPVAFIATGKFWVNNHAHIVQGNERSTTRFLHYALAATDISGYLTGSTMPKLTQGNLNRIPVVAPPLPEQKRIAHILGTLDDKIELNRRMNATLEAMSRAIFKSWFVDFHPVRQKAAGKQPVGMDAQTAALFPDSFEDSEIGEVPKGWRGGTIGECVEVVDCLHTKKPDRTADGKPLLQLANIRDDGLLDMTDCFFISEDDYRKWSFKFETQTGDCVITNVGRVGAVAQVPPGVTAALGRNMTGLRPKPSFPFPTFTLECLLSQEMREEIGRKTDSGTILNALNVKSIPRLRLAIPCNTAAAAYEAIARPIRRGMEDRLKESRTLAALRDTLLPKLLSGEVRVPEADQAVEEAIA
jgi:type I restriction enzyme S subunit